MSENNRASVYVHINLVNGKKYFGITTWKPERRWGKDGKRYSHHEHFTNAINKYGWNNFAHYVLYRNIPIKIAKNIEEMLIKEHMTYDRLFGYNKTHGGELEKRSKESRKKTSKALKEYFEEHPEACEARSEAMKGELNPMNKPEVRAKNAEAQHKKPVEAIDPETGLVVLQFPSINAAEREGFYKGPVWRCCNSKQKKHKGFIWRYIDEGVDDDGNY